MVGIAARIGIALGRYPAQLELGIVESIHLFKLKRSLLIGLDYPVEAVFIGAEVIIAASSVKNYGQLFLGDYLFKSCSLKVLEGICVSVTIASRRGIIYRIFFHLKHLPFIIIVNFLLQVYFNTFPTLCQIE